VRVVGFAFGQPDENGHFRNGRAETASQPLLRAEYCVDVGCLHCDAQLRTRGRAVDALADTACQGKNRDWKEWAEQEEEERTAEQDRDEIAPRHDVSGLEQR